MARAAMEGRVDIVQAGLQLTTFLGGREGYATEYASRRSYHRLPSTIARCCYVFPVSLADPVTDLRDRSDD
jgi:hypothetical protein